MRFKRLLAGVMAFVFSLNMSHINVNAEEKSGKIIDEKEKAVIVLKKEDITKDESIDESTAKKFFVKAADGTVYIAKTAGSVVKFVLKEFLRGALVVAGAAFMALCLFASSAYMIIKINENVRNKQSNPFGYLYKQWCEFKQTAVPKKGLF